MLFSHRCSRRRFLKLFEGLPYLRGKGDYIVQYVLPLLNPLCFSSMMFSSTHCISFLLLLIKMLISLIFSVDDLLVLSASGLSFQIFLIISLTTFFHSEGMLAVCYISLNVFCRTNLKPLLIYFIVLS